MIIIKRRNELFNWIRDQRTASFRADQTDWVQDFHNSFDFGSARSWISPMVPFLDRLFLSVDPRTGSRMIVKYFALGIIESILSEYLTWLVNMSGLISWCRAPCNCFLWKSRPRRHSPAFFGNAKILPVTFRWYSCIDKLSGSSRSGNISVPDAYR